MSTDSGINIIFIAKEGVRGWKGSPSRDASALEALVSHLDFNEDTFSKSAAAFDNPDFVEVVIHSYRHRFGLVEGDPAYAEIEARLAKQPAITVPAITFDGEDDGVRKPSYEAPHAQRFSGSRVHRVIPGVGHNMPQEIPEIFGKAVLELVRA